jgi:sugar phosphate isomerase/epimerase
MAITSNEKTMIHTFGWPTGICSWSLQQNLTGVAACLRSLGIQHIHLAVGQPNDRDSGAFLTEAQAQDWIITSAMIDFAQEDYSSLESIRLTGGIVPDAQWPSNRQRFIQAADLAAALGTPFLSMHAGFLDPAQTGRTRIFHDRIQCLADAAGEKNLTLLLETGQESAADLREFLEELAHPAVGLNFDPANMILYDKDDPVSAVKILAPWIRHAHVKDAVRTQIPGQWGREVPWGEGEVGGDAFLLALQATGFNGAVAIERESGTQRLTDIATAVKRLASSALPNNSA